MIHSASKSAFKAVVGVSLALVLAHCGAEPAERSARGAPSGGAVNPSPPTSGAPDGAAPAASDDEGSGVSAAAPTSEGNPTVQGLLPPAAEASPPGSGMVPPPGMDPVTPVAEPPAFSGSFILGADISGVQELIEGGAVFVDTDGVEKPVLLLLKNHGFNFVRLRTFVEPSAPYGYASGNGCQAKAEAYDDRDHTVEFAREVKAAGMGFLLDFHYSDTWADPGKQVIPEAWRGAQSVAELASQAQAYTADVMQALVAAGARPDLVQVGNEITPGLMIHVPTANTDCYGSNSATNPRVNGSAANWDNTALLLSAGIAGVRQVDPDVRVMLHIENTANPNGVVNWVQNALSRDVAFDVLGLSAYEEFQGPATAWRGTLQMLATRFPELSFVIAEYNPQRRLLNDIMRELPEARGLGTFFWEPTQSGAWGQAMFARQGNRFTARAADFAEYDQMRQDFGL